MYFFLTHRVINKLQPGSVAKINSGKMAFKLMENISNFLDAITRYGVAKTDLFQTVDLYEAENIPQVWLLLYAITYILNALQVTACIHALGRQVKFY